MAGISHEGPEPDQKLPKNPTVPDDAADTDEEEFHDARFPAEEEARLLKESQTIKQEANQLFSSACYDQAISSYDRALSSCPSYLDYDVAVLRSNIAACYLKLEDWKAAIDAATASLDRLEKIIPTNASDDKQSDGKQSNATNTTPEESGAVVELSAADAEAEEKQLAHLKELDTQRTNVLRIRAKSLMRRAKAKSSLGGWANLQGAIEDYQALNSMETLPSDEKRIVQRALRELPARVNEAKEKEIGEMMSKMKDLGNGILRPFGLSTDNFNFVQDPKTGGYSMNFQS
ncbi:putative tetratricopeptide repeat protein 1 (TTC1) [Penicillium brasilianum]|uniref:Putative tetratricopeptide repeat protein 1 (TTC1) n=1 Tax=Penicillium brasilianum TaxID=104259 RepID=A0A1S9RN90_PENBI|nr:putative tetratricopeptide repeat protein 1 (TTC1) [Penicillium brasilianum]